MFRSRTPRSAVAAALSIVLIAAFMVGTTSAATNQQGTDRAAAAAPKPKPSPTPTPTPIPTPTPTPTPNSDNRTVYFGDLRQPSGRRRSPGPDDGHSGQHVQVRLVHRERGQPAADPLPGRLRQSCRRPSGIEPQPARRRYDRVRDAQLRDHQSNTVHDRCRRAGRAVRSGPVRCRRERRLRGSSSTLRASAVATTTYASFKVAENVPDQGANRNTFFADADLDVGPTNSNSNATWKTGGALLAVDGRADAGQEGLDDDDGHGFRATGSARSASPRKTVPPTSAPGQIATVHVQDGAPQTPYLEWTTGGHRFDRWDRHPRARRARRGRHPNRGRDFAIL